MNKFRIENLDFCQSTRSENASIITGTGVSGVRVPPIHVVVLVEVQTLTLVEGLTGASVGAVAGAAAAAIGKKPVASASTDIFANIV